MRFWKWWSLVVSTIFAVIGGQYYFDIFNYILVNDITYLSFLIMGIFSLATITIGVKWKRQKENVFIDNENTLLWYTTEVCMGLGMIGTLLGFLIVLSTAFSSVDVTSIESMKTLISTLATGMGTALLTTLVGLIASLLLKFQLIMLEENDE